jgi:hypothetical protein
MPPILDTLHADYYIADQHRSAERRRLLRAARPATPAGTRPGPTVRAVRFAAATLGRGLVALGTRLESAGRSATADCPAGC